MKAIIKREFDAYFSSMLGYVFLAIFLLLTGSMFFLMNILTVSASMKNFFAQVNMWAIFILPMLTMRMFSEDRKMKTDLLLMAAPISVTEIVLGKFFAAMGVFLIGIIVTFFYPITLNLFGILPVAETISCYVGFVLLCSAIIAIGAFMSSLTESQIVAAVSTYGILLLTICLGTAASSIRNPFISSALLWLSPLQRFSSFTMGILDVESMVYYISLICLFLFFTIAVFEKRRFQ